MLKVDLIVAQNSGEFHLTANVSVLRYDTVPTEFLTKIVNFKDGAERFVKAQSEGREAAQTKSSGHKSQGPLQARPLGEILSIAEIFFADTNSEVYVPRNWCTKHSRIDNILQVRKILSGPSQLPE